MSLQRQTGASLIRSGLSLQLLGLLWGGAVQLTPFPRLALTAHKQLMVEGGMVLLAGVVLLQTSAVRVGTLGCRTIYWGLAGVWITMASEIANAFWGTKQALPIAAMEAGAQGALEWQEKLVTAAHVIPAIGLILALFVLVSGTFGGEEEKKSE